MSKRAYRFPEDFVGWQDMHSTKPGRWIYFDPTNRLAALIAKEAPRGMRVLIIYDRKTEEPIYENKKAIRKEAKTFRAPRLI